MSEPSRASPYRLLVEGPNDKWSVINLLKRNGYNWDDESFVRPYIHDAGGVEKLLRRPDLHTSLKTYDRLGIILDADLDPSGRWDGLRRHLHGVVDLPKAPERGGTIVDRPRESLGSGVSRLGIWLMPDNDSSGVLESFLAKLVPSGDRCWEHAVESTRRAREDFGAPLKEKDLAKGRIHAWLAWREESGQPLGQAINARVLSHDTPEALSFVAWFRRLFQ
jgi:hypothetical protein